LGETLLNPREDAGLSNKEDLHRQEGSQQSEVGIRVEEVAAQLRKSQIRSGRRLTGGNKLQPVKEKEEKKKEAKCNRPRTKGLGKPKLKSPNIGSGPSIPSVKREKKRRRLIFKKRRRKEPGQSLFHLGRRKRVHVRAHGRRLMLTTEKKIRADHQFGGGVVAQGIP